MLVDALGVDEEEVTPNATLRDDLGAESIDFLDIVFRLEKAFGIKIPRGEMFPEDIFTNPAYVQNGKVTPEGMAELKKRMPHMDFTELEKDPDVNKMQLHRRHDRELHRDQAEDRLRTRVKAVRIGAQTAFCTADSCNLRYLHHALDLDRQVHRVHAQDVARRRSRTSRWRRSTCTISIPRSRSCRTA